MTTVETFITEDGHIIVDGMGWMPLVDDVDPITEEEMDLIVKGLNGLTEEGGVANIEGTWKDGTTVSIMVFFDLDYPPCYAVVHRDGDLIPFALMTYALVEDSDANDDDA